RPHNRYEFSFFNVDIDVFQNVIFFIAVFEMSIDIYKFYHDDTSTLSPSFIDFLGFLINLSPFFRPSFTKISPFTLSILISRFSTLLSLPSTKTLLSLVNTDFGSLMASNGTSTSME